MTYPIIGNYGICFDDMEDDRPWPDGFIVRELATAPSNFRNECGLSEFLKDHDTVSYTHLCFSSNAFRGVFRWNVRRFDFKQKTFARISLKEQTES